MSNQLADMFMSDLLREIGSGQLRAGGKRDDDDDRDDEHSAENEAPVRETDENTEAPEEFSGDDEGESTRGEANNDNGGD